MMFLGVFVLAVCGLASRVAGDAAVAWCYHQPSCNDTKWPALFPDFCNGSRQSPINIDSSAAEVDSSLTSFSFTNFNNKSALKVIRNTGKTVKIELASGVKISGGGLSDPYDSLQFHLHWGNGSNVPGSEHTVNGVRYPMEMHIVNVKSSYNGNTTQAVQDSTGLAALGFFIQVMSGNDTGKPEGWKNLTNYIKNITQKDQSITISAAISLDDLIAGVNLTKYYRYLGSLTTPMCNEAVVWTVFKEPIKVSKDLINLFSNMLHVGDNSSTPLMVNTYRGIQPDLKVTTQESSASSTSYSLGLILLCLAVWKN